MPDKKAGDISDLFSNPVPDLSWLDVNEKDYQALETLPKQNLDFRPDLEELWTHHEKGPVHFVPNIDPERLGKHQWVKDSSNNKDVVATVARHVKDRIMSGWAPATVAAWVRENVDPMYIAHLVPTLKKLAGEQGLLGTVYIDATSWDNCDRGEGKKIAAKAPHSFFVMANESKCGDCIHNESGRCAVFRKELVFDAVPYSDDVVKQYSDKLKVPKQAFDNLKSVQAKLRAIFTYDGTTTDNRDVVSEVSPAITEGNQAARDRRAQGLYTPPSTDFVSAADRNLYRDLSQKMMLNRGVLSDTVKSRLAAASSEAITALAREENLLGRVYVRPDQFSDCHKANKFFRRHSVGGDYIMEIPSKCARCHFNRAATDGSRCGLMNRKVVQEIPYTSDLLASDLSDLVDRGRMTREVANTFLIRASGEADLKNLVREAHTYKVVKKAVYSNVEPVREMGRFDAVAIISDQQLQVPLKHRPVVRAMYTAMFAGKTGRDLKDAMVTKCGRDAVVAAQSSFAPLVPLAGILGHVVLDPRSFKSADEAKSYLRSHAMKPHYILKEGCGCGGGAAPGAEDHKKHFPNLILINLGTIGEIEGEFVLSSLDKLENHRRITPTLAAELRDKVGTASPVDILRVAYTTPATAPVKPYRKAKAAPAKVNRKKVARELQAASDAATLADNNHVRGAIKAARDADKIGANAAGVLRNQVGKRENSRILVSLEVAKLNHLPASTFKATDLTAVISQIENTKEATHEVVTASQKAGLRKRVVQAMNKGLSGTGLKRWLRNSFAGELIKAESAYIKEALQNQGLLGNHYIDPRPYSKCEQGAAEVSGTNSMYVQAMSKCSGCIFRNANDHCSVYRRDVVTEVPYAESREATQHAILNPVVAAIPDIEENPVQEFGMVGDMDALDLNPTATRTEQDIGFDNAMGGLGDL